ncbi:type IV secretion system protein [Burkholderia gladioli]|uniref:type IV secretion system protein n=1 Tax=Burkholderia gladioli TaxID=28095 RepID=UPI001640252E|nr:type IV secretion system protein [Burkholderia gladioli]MDN7465808.1 type IV secretion system protein [Burkholderia gladioli]
MRHARNIILSVMLLAVGFAPFAAVRAQGIPTLDASSLAQAIATVQQLKAQYDQIVTQVNMIKGNRGLGMILNNPALRNYLPDQWQSVYDLVKAGQLNGISGLAQQYLQQEGWSAATAGATRLNNTQAANKAMATQAYDQVIARLQNIQSLMQQNDLTQDPAAKADLQNRWSAEITQINADKTRLDLMGRLQDIEEKFAQQQAHHDMQALINGN